MPKRKYILKNVSLKILVGFPPIFAADTKLIYGCNFVAYSTKIKRHYIFNYNKQTHFRYYNAFVYFWIFH